MGQHGGQQGVAALVVGGGPPLLGRHDEALPLGAEDDAIAGVLEVDAFDLLGAATHGDERGLVDEVGEVGAGHARCGPGHDVQVDVGADPLVTGVHLEDRPALLELG